MTLGERVRSERIARGWRLKDLAEKSGVDIGTISALETRRSTKSEFGAALAKAFDLTVEQLMSDRTAGPPIPPDGMVDQSMSQYGPTVPPKHASEDEVKAGKVGEQFCLLVRDESGGDEFPRGSSIIWSTTRSPDIGRVILVKDRFEQLRIRRKKQGRSPQTWIAAPLHPDFSTLDSENDGLVLVAVKLGHMERDD